MRTIVKRQLFTQRVFDSGSLGVLASVIHQFGEAGAYEAKTYLGESPAGAFSFVVDPDSKVQQLTIDLAELGREKEDCKCEGEKREERIVSPKGYVLFYASRGIGYSVRVGRGNERQAAFDSRQLGSGDLFAVSLLEPTTYSVVDRIGGGKAEITVELDPARIRKANRPDPVYADAKKGAIEPRSIRLVSAQGLVFRISTGSRVVIEKTGQAADRKERGSLHRVFRAPMTQSATT